MIFSLMIQDSPAGAASSRAACRFARELLAGGHTLYRVFFYGEGATHANALQLAPPGDDDLPACWQALAQEHGIDLVSCVGSALRRGVVDPREAARAGLPASSLRAGFELSGLGQLVDATLRSDRVVSFGG